MSGSGRVRAWDFELFSRFKMKPVYNSDCHRVTSLLLPRFVKASQEALGPSYGWFRCKRRGSFATCLVKRFSSEKRCNFDSLENTIVRVLSSMYTVWMSRLTMQCILCKTFCSFLSTCVVQRRCVYTVDFVSAVKEIQSFIRFVNKLNKWTSILKRWKWHAVKPPSITYHIFALT